MAADCHNPRMPKHEDYRQGVVYGPQRSYGGRDLGSIMGSLLGLLVVAGTVGLLGFGVIFFLQQHDDCRVAHAG